MTSDTTPMPEMPPYQVRVIDEKNELDKKADALSRFIGSSPAFLMVDPAEQNRLRKQLGVMWRYSEILGCRIAAFKETA